VYRDYHPKGVEFYFIYQRLAHPELVGHYVQPFTLEERLTHAQEAEKRLGCSIPWIVDAMDNRLSHALGRRANSEVIIDPNRVIVRKRAWSHPEQVRKDLEQLVGPVERITLEKDVHLAFEVPRKTPAPRGLVSLVDRSGLEVVRITPRIDRDGTPYFAKLRAEADVRLLTEGTGQLYLGFHLDPFHNAHWNNLTKPLSVQLETPLNVTVDGGLTHASPAVTAPSDTDPREFLLKVNGWQNDEPLRLTVTYYACVGETSCHVVRQHYEVHRSVDPDGGAARGEGAGFWKREGFAAKALERDKNRDGKLDRTEVQGLILPHFRDFDASRDGFLERAELQAVVDWLNFHHMPGAPPTGEPAKLAR
jgi:hypothetical protein